MYGYDCGMTKITLGATGCLGYGAGGLEDTPLGHLHNITPFLGLALATWHLTLQRSVSFNYLSVV